MFRGSEHASSSIVFVVNRSLISAVVLALMLSVAIKGQVGGGHLVFGDFKVSESKDGKPTPQVFNIVLYSVFGSVVARQTVTNHGRYQFYNVNNGEYDIVVEVESQEIARTHVVLTSSLRSDFRYDISLEWRTSAGTNKRTGTVSAEDLYDRVQPNKARYEKAEEAFENKKYDQAIALFQQIVADDPADFQAWSELGTVYLLKEAFNDAEKSYLAAIDARPTFFLANMNLGRLYFSQKKFDKAVNALGHAVQIKPQSADANQLLGEAYLQIKKGSVAVGYLNEALRLDPQGKAEIHLRLALLYHGAGMKDKAAAEYAAFLKKRPDYKDRKKLEDYISANKKP